jgi:hypothetical protein
MRYGSCPRGEGRIVEHSHHIRYIRGVMRRVLTVVVFAAAMLTGPVEGAASAGPRLVRDLPALQQACRQAQRPGVRRLHSVIVPHFAFGRYDADERFLLVDTRRNLRALDGAAELFPAELEPLGFQAGPERAQRLRRAAREGARLRVGFFLAFDGHHERPCLIQSAFGVTTVRMDVAFVELVGRDGRAMARQETDRLRAWRETLARERIDGEGPRGALRQASLSSRPGGVPERWQRALMAANEGPVRPALGVCHAGAIERGGARSGRVVVRLTVEPATGRVRAAAVELSTVETAGAECVAAEVGRHLRLPSAADLLGNGLVDLSVPVDLAR